MKDGGIRLAVWPALLGVGLLVADRVTKHFFRLGEYGEGPFRLEGVLNQGFAFGIPFSRWVWAVGLLVFFVLLALYVRKAGIRHARIRFGLAFLLAGGASNALDRFEFGGVVDWIHLFGLWAVNLADIWVLIGLLTFVTREFKREKRTADPVKGE